MPAQDEPGVVAYRMTALEARFDTLVTEVREGVAAIRNDVAQQGFVRSDLYNSEKQAHERDHATLAGRLTTLESSQSSKSNLLRQVALSFASALILAILLLVIQLAVGPQ
jgi:hypothetical protein